jgi:hypothetical protein
MLAYPASKYDSPLAPASRGAGLPTLSGMSSGWAVSLGCEPAGCSVSWEISLEWCLPSMPPVGAGAASAEGAPP